MFIEEPLQRVSPGASDASAEVARLHPDAKASPLRARWEVADPIDREVLARALNATVQSSLDQNTQWYVGEDGLLAAPKLMAGWRTFWRKDGLLAVEDSSHREPGPHLTLMAFLQRVVNGGVNIDR